MSHYKVFKNSNYQEFKNVDVSIGTVGQLVIHELFAERNSVNDILKVRPEMYVIFAPGSWDMIERIDIVKSDNTIVIV